VKRDTDEKYTVCPFGTATGHRFNGPAPIPSAVVLQAQTKGRLNGGWSVTHDVATLGTTKSSKAQVLGILKLPNGRRLRSIWKLSHSNCSASSWNVQQWKSNLFFGQQRRTFSAKCYQHWLQRERTAAAERHGQNKNTRFKAEKWLWLSVCHLATADRRQCTAGDSLVFALVVWLWHKNGDSSTA